MACAPCAKKQEQMRYSVVTASGRTVYRTNSQESAQRISKNYPGSSVKDKNA